MLKIVLKFIGLIIVTISIILIYDARSITKKYFGFGDQNEATLGLKLLGALLSILGGLLVYFNI